MFDIMVYVLFMSKCVPPLNFLFLLPSMSVSSWPTSKAWRSLAFCSLNVKSSKLREQISYLELQYILHLYCCK